MARPLTLERFAGEPVVLAIADGWSPRASVPKTIEAVRAELRGLGAALVALTEDGLFTLAPDDGPSPSAKKGELDAAEVERLRARLGVPAAPSLGVFVLDPHGDVRFAHVVPAEPADEPLLAALSSAGRALVAPRPRSLVVSRREVVTSCLVAGFALAFADGCRPPAAQAPPPGIGQPQMQPPTNAVSGDVDVVLDVNGAPRRLRIDPRVSLLDALRERLAMMGTKKGCDHGQCGACTVLVDGRRVSSCLMLAIMVQHAKITTIEGLAKDGALHPVQAAFVAEDGLQCGYCTPGQIMSAVGMLAEGHAETDDEVREAMSGNVCRCGAYPNIVAAIQRARRGGAS